MCCFATGDAIMSAPSDVEQFVITDNSKRFTPSATLRVRGVEIVVGACVVHLGTLYQGGSSEDDGLLVNLVSSAGDSAALDTLQQQMDAALRSYVAASAAETGGEADDEGGGTGHAPTPWVRVLPADAKASQVYANDPMRHAAAQWFAAFERVARAS